MTPENETPGAGTSGAVSQSESKSSFATLVGHASGVNFGVPRQVS
jgi:hypothetical protein